MLHADVAEVAAVDIVDVASKLDNTDAGAGTTDTIEILQSVVGQRHDLGIESTQKFSQPYWATREGTTLNRYVPLLI